MQKTIALILFAVTSLIATATFAAIHEDHPYTFTMTKHVYKLSEVYQIKSTNQDTYPGSVKKSAFRVRTNYDLSDKNGWQATGITRILSFGAIYPWAKDIDIYDTRGVRIGLIDGNFATLELAKFNLYEYDDNGIPTEVGMAYASHDFNHFVIVQSISDPHPIAEFNRNMENRTTWTVTVHYPEKIDDRMIRILAGFIMDYQDKFMTVATPDDEE